jgi:Thrombospondin type 3 repeat/Right handed beta helix region
MFTRLAILSVFVSILALAWFSPNTAAGASFVVDTAADDQGITLTACTGASADCSLRGAITNANGSGAADVITFDPAVFPAGGAPTTIPIATSLPLVFGNETIDGAGAAVLIDANGEAPTFQCLQLFTGNAVRNLQFTDCSTGIATSFPMSDNNIIGPGNVFFDNLEAIGMQNSDATGNTVIGNFVGTNPGGTAVPAEGGNQNGIVVGGSNNTVGGDTAAERNIISGNNNIGVFIVSFATANTVTGNYVGPDVTGTTDLSNASGIHVAFGAPSNTIGGTEVGEANLISGNDIGVFLDGERSVLIGNIIGPDTNGGGVLSNGIGVQILSGASESIIAGNVISDQDNTGIVLTSGANLNTVTGNRIGTNPAGTAALPNLRGVFLLSGASGNTIGGTAPSDGNIIAFNSAQGIVVSGATTINNSIRGNSLHDSKLLEIDNFSGGNTELPPPVVTAAGASAAGGTTCAACEIDVFSDGAADAEFYEGSTTADTNGNWSLSTSIAGPNVTATTTDNFGNTSELSAASAFTTDTDGDTYPDPLDNCPVDSNPIQADADGDGQGDACDSNADNDAFPNTSDPCPTLAEDYDGYQDETGCPEPDNDLDGICDAGQTSVSCTGSDTGQRVFDPAGTLPAPFLDCRNTPEDDDAFKDDDGCPEPDNDNDGFPDVTDDCPGTDSRAGTDGVLGSPEDLNHNGVRDGAEVTLTTDDVMPALVWEDSDGVLDTDGCHDSPGDDFDGDGLTDDSEVFAHLTNAAIPDTDADRVIDGPDNCRLWPNPSQTVPAWALTLNDSDCDGFTQSREIYLTTNPTMHCAATITANDEGTPDFWPLDMNDSRQINTVDVGAFVSKLGLDNTEVGWTARLDLNQSTNGIINTVDVGNYVGRLGNVCSPSGP